MGSAASSARSQRDFELLDLYEVLEIDEIATKEEIKRAYYKQSREHHPDKNLNDAGATKRFTRVLEAYQTLMDDEKRAVYNYTRSQTAHAEARPPPAPQDRPGSFSARSDTRPPTNIRIGWLGAVFGLLYYILAWLSSWWSPRVRFVYKDYLANAYVQGFVEGPGISVQDILDFIKSVPEGKNFDIKRDHDDNGLFSIFDNFFQCIALDEHRWGSRVTFPRFGCAHYVWSRTDWDWDPRFAPFVRGAPEAQDFYTFWSRFETLKTFEWVAPNNPSTPRLQRKRNKEAQHQTRRAYNEIIQVIVKSILKIDPRHLIHLARVSEKAQRDVPVPTPNINRDNNHNSGHKKRRNRKKKKA